MNNIQKINKLLKKSLENENLEQLANKFISEHPIENEACLEFRLKSGSLQKEMYNIMARDNALLNIVNNLVSGLREIF